jgi:hypothetical protein
VLDHVPEGNSGRAKFVREVLREFGVSWTQRLRFVRLVSQKLPADLHNVDMTEVLRVFEEVLGIEWEEDVYLIEKEDAARFAKAVLVILEARTPAQLPKEIASRVIEELRRVVGPKLEPSLLPGVSEKLETLFINELWRTKDKSKREELKARILYCVKEAARLDFGSVSEQ